MLTKNIEFKNFKISLNNIKIKNELKIILNIQTEILKSLKPSYKYSYSKRILNKLKKNSLFRIIGMGGSILGAEAIYDFLKYKIKKKLIIFNQNYKKKKTKIK